MPFDALPTEGVGRMHPLEKQVIARAYQLIEDPKHWTQYAQARLEDGTIRCPTSNEAVSFCAKGALWRAARDIAGSPDFWPSYDAVIGRIGLHTNGIWLTTINDHQGHAAVLALFKKALTA